MEPLIVFSFGEVDLHEANGFNFLNFRGFELNSAFFYMQ